MSAAVVIRTPLASLTALVLNGLNSEHSRRAYEKALGDFFGWYEDTAAGRAISKAMVQEWVAYQRDDLELSPSTINLRLSAVKKLVVEAADNQLLDPTVAQAISRVRGVKKTGTRLGNWLTIESAEQLLAAPSDSFKGKRDGVILGLLVGCGLRRSELSGLTFEQVQQREGRWILVDLIGKGSRTRSVPMPAWTKVLMDEWSAASGLTSGRVLRPLNRRHEIAGDRLNEADIHKIVRRYGRKIGCPTLAPHDLRRTFAKLAHKGRAPLEQIQLSLGHASIQTTERYLGVRQNLDQAPCDCLGLRIR
jgi:integrase/recombinase XerD